LSTILKALRRIEEQKARGAERPLREDVVFAPAARRRVATSVLVAVTAVAFALTLAGLTLLRGGRSERDVSQPERAAAPVAAPVSAAPPAQAAPTPVEPAPRAEPTAPVPQVAAVAPSPQVSAPSSAAARDAAASAEVVVVHPNAREPSPPRVESAGDAPPFAKRTAPKRVAAAAPLRVVRTSWHPRPEKRAAWVQLSGAATAVAVHEGDHVGSYVVREIEPAAVVFADGSVEIRRSVGP